MSDPVKKKKIQQLHLKPDGKTAKHTDTHTAGLQNRSRVYIAEHNRDYGQCMGYALSAVY